MGSILHDSDLDFASAAKCLGLGAPSANGHAMRYDEFGSTNAGQMTNSGTPAFNGLTLTNPLGTQYGGLGLNNSAATGVPVFAAGVATMQDYLNQSVKSSALPTFAKATLNASITDASMAGIFFVTPTFNTTTTSGAYQQYCFSISPTMIIATGKSQTGSVGYSGFIATIVRSNASDLGSLTNMSCGLFQYGHSGTNNCTTTNAVGVKIAPFHASGSITTSTALQIQSAVTGITPGTYYAIDSQDSAAINRFAGTAQIGGKLTSYNGVSTVSNGVPALVASGRFTAQTAAKSSVASYTVGAADSSFVVTANVLVTTATAHSFTMTVAYTDEGNTARTATLSFQALAGGAPTTAIANAGGAVPYSSFALPIRCKTGTTITVATTGTFSTVTYNVEAFIEQVG